MAVGEGDRESAEGITSGFCFSFAFIDIYRPLQRVRKGPFAVKTIKIGVIGTGGISNAHMGGYKQLQDVEVVAGADIIAGRAQAWAERHGVPHAFDDYRQLLAMDEIDAVSVCTYNRGHCQPTVDALRAGKHVLCEKPMAHNLEDAWKMLRAARETKKMLMIGVHSRFSRSQQQAKRIVASGALGDLYYAEIVSTRRRGIPSGTFLDKETSGGGAVIDIGIYALDTALDIMGQPRPVSVSATTCDRIGRSADAAKGTWNWEVDRFNVEEFGAAWIRFNTGLVLLFKTSWAVHIDSLGRSYFLGDRGGLAMDPLELYRDEFGTMVNITPKQREDRVDRFKEETLAFTTAVRDRTPAPIP